MFFPSSRRKIVLLFGEGNRENTRLAVKQLSVLSMIITLIQQGLGALVTGRMLGAAQTE